MILSEPVGCQSIHPLSVPLILRGSWGVGANLSWHMARGRWRGGGGGQVESQGRTNHHTVSDSHLKVIWILQVTSAACIWTLGGVPERKPTQTQGEHANCIHPPPPPFAARRHVWRECRYRVHKGLHGSLCGRLGAVQSFRQLKLKA